MEQCIQTIQRFDKRDDRLKYLSGFLLYAANNNFDLSVKGLCKRLFNNYDANNIRKIQRDIKYLVDTGIIKITKRFYKGATQFFKVAFLKIYKTLQDTTKKISTFFINNNSENLKTDLFILKVNKLKSRCQDINFKKLDDLFVKLDYLTKKGIKKINIPAFIYSFQASQTQTINNFASFYWYILNKTDYRIDFKYLKDYLQKENISNYIKIRHLQYYDIQKDYNFSAPYCNLSDWKRIKTKMLDGYSFHDVFSECRFSKMNIINNNKYNNNNNITDNSNNLNQSIEKSQFNHESIANEFQKLRKSLKLSVLDKF